MKKLFHWSLKYNSRYFSLSNASIGSRKLLTSESAQVDLFINAYFFHGLVNTSFWVSLNAWDIIFIVFRQFGFDNISTFFRKNNQKQRSIHFFKFLLSKFVKLSCFIYKNICTCAIQPVTKFYFLRSTTLRDSCQLNPVNKF